MRRRNGFVLIVCISWASRGLAAADDGAPLVEYGRGAIELLMRAPDVFSSLARFPFLAESAFKSLSDSDAAGEQPAARSWSSSLDSILFDGIDLLDDLVTRSKWSAVRPPELDGAVTTTASPAMRARISIPLSDEEPIEARVAIETDAVREDYFLISTELAAAAIDRWLTWSTRLDYRASQEAPAWARAEQRVSLRVTQQDAIGVSGRLEDHNLDAAVSPMVDLAPAGELFWSHRWPANLESSLKVQQTLPDLQTWWSPARGERGDVRFEGSVRAALNPATRVDLRGTASPDLTEYGIRLQLEFLLGRRGASGEE